MKRVLWGSFSLALFLVAGGAYAFVRPSAEEGLLPDFDLRKNAAVASGARTPLAAEAEAAAVNQPPAWELTEPKPVQRAALDRLRAKLGPAIAARFGGIAGLPKMLFNINGVLRGPSSADAVSISRSFLKENADLFRLSAAEIDAMRVSRDIVTPGTGMHSVLLVQQVRGVDVYLGEVRISLARDGSVIWASAADVQPGLDLDVHAFLGPDAAIAAAARFAGVQFASAPSQKGTSTARSLYYDAVETYLPIEVSPWVFPVRQGGHLAWQVTLAPMGSTAVYDVVVDARAGRLLSRHNRTLYATTNAGQVFAGQFPDTFPVAGKSVPQSQVSFGYRWPSTVGWTGTAPYANYDITLGNNVDVTANVARSDRIPAPLPTEPPRVYALGGPMQEWFFPFTNAYEKSGVLADAAIDAGASVTNLFYQINNWHDYAHLLGFDEKSGNFQQDNFSRGGCGNDIVYAYALYGSQPATGGVSLNNANFSTPAEDTVCPAGGNVNGIMRMFLWGNGFPNRDGSLDADIVIHEMNHGVSTRLVGGPTVGCLGGTQSGAMGEGWSDWWPGSYFNDPVLAEYATGDTVAGIRCYAMDQNPRTYAELCTQCANGCEVHSDGEIHASTLWDVRKLVGKAVIEQLVMDAYKLMPCSPSFLDERDALILADQNRYGGSHVCQIWQAYLARGMGFDAKGADSPYHVPDFLFNSPACTGDAFLRYDSYTTSDKVGGNDDGLYSVGETIDLDVKLQNLDGASIAKGVTATVSTSTPGVSMVQATRPYANIAKGGKGSPTQPFSFRIDPGFVCGSKVDFQVQMNWNPALTRTDSFSDAKGWTPGLTLLSDTVDPAVWTMGSNAGVSSAHNHTAAGTQSYYMIQGCYAGDNPDQCGLACDASCNTITSPAFKLPPDQAARIGFWATYNLEYTWDGVWVEVSSDGGNSWNFVDTVNYNSTSPGNPGSGCSPANDHASINGPANNALLVPWTYFEGSLEAYAGMTIQVRIVEHNDDCVYFEGAYIDDIQVLLSNCTNQNFVNLIVDGQSLNDGVAPACTDNDANPDAGETLNWDVTVRNVGNSTANNVTGSITTANANVTIVTGSQNYGNLASGQTATRTFQYTVAPDPAVQCFEPMTMTVTINDASGFTRTENYPYEMRKDSGTVFFLDNFDSGLPPWTHGVGPSGTVDDWDTHTLNCVAAAGVFWATQQGMNPAVCSTGEPDYSADSDSVLTSPDIDLTNAGNKLTQLSWTSLGVLNTVPVGKGYVEISIDHDGDGVFTAIARADGGFGATNIIDIQNNPLGVPISASSTAAKIKVRVRFRATTADSGPTGDQIGMLFNDFRIEWQPCDMVPCAPGFAGKGGSETGVGIPGSLDKGLGLKTLPPPMSTPSTTTPMGNKPPTGW